ncbi:hypothetical protein MTO96_045772, partial [Rhipicephalus appendiculatus]
EEKNIYMNLDRPGVLLTILAGDDDHVLITNVFHKTVSFACVTTTRTPRKYKSTLTLRHGVQELNYVAPTFPLRKWDVYQQRSLVINKDHLRVYEQKNLLIRISVRVSRLIGLTMRSISPAGIGATPPPAG